MEHNRFFAIVRRVLLFFVLALAFSAGPLLISLFTNKSSLFLAVVMAWYVLIPPIVMCFVAWWLYHKEENVLLFLGHVWVAAGIWFVVQYVLLLISDASIFFALLNFPSMSVGNHAMLSGSILFLGGGLAAIWGARRITSTQRLAVPFARDRISAGLVFGITLIALPLVIWRSSVPQLPPMIEEEQLPLEDEIFSWAVDLYDLGGRLPGSQADLNAIAYIENKFKEFGYTDVNSEFYTFNYWVPKSWSLKYQGGSGELESVESFYVPYSGPTDDPGITADLVYIGTGQSADLENADLKGKVVLVDLPAVNIGWDQMKLFTYLAYDPQNTASGQEHPFPVGWMLVYRSVYERLEKQGVAGIVGILEEYPDLGALTYYAPYDGVLRSIPSFYISESSGELLKNSLDSGNVSAELILQADITMDGGRSANVYAVLPGKSDSTVLIHSHHDSAWPGAVEDSSGVASVLALAKFYSQQPLEARPRTMVFLLTGSHMVGEPGSDIFIEEHEVDIMEHLVVDIVVEHIAWEHNPPDAPSGLIEPRGIFTTESPILISVLAQSLIANNQERSLIFPTQSPLGVPTDGGEFSRAGYPIASSISGPTWLFDDHDTLELLAKEQLVPLAKMHIDFIRGINERPDWLLSINANSFVIGYIVFLLTPLLAMNAAVRPRE